MENRIFALQLTKIKVVSCLEETCLKGLSLERMSYLRKPQACLSDLRHNWIKVVLQCGDLQRPYKHSTQSTNERRLSVHTHQLWESCVDCQFFKVHLPICIRVIIHVLVHLCGGRSCSHHLCEVPEIVDRTDRDENGGITCQPLRAREKSQ